MCPNKMRSYGHHNQEHQVNEFEEAVHLIGADVIAEIDLMGDPVIGNYKKADRKGDPHLNFCS